MRAFLIFCLSPYACSGGKDSSEGDDTGDTATTGVADCGQCSDIRGVQTGVNASGNAQTAVDIANGTTDADVATSDFIAWANGVHANWVGISIAFQYTSAVDTSLVAENRPDGYVEWNDGVIYTYDDEALIALTEAFHDAGKSVYWTFAFEPVDSDSTPTAESPWTYSNQDRDLMGWPWSEVGPDASTRGYSSGNWPWDDPESTAVQGFWDSYENLAVQYATLAAENGVEMLSLGTETDGLMRTSFGANNGDRVLGMIDAVRAPTSGGGAAYGGLLTYDMHWSSFSDAGRRVETAIPFWEDTGLDVIGVSAWIPLTGTGLDCGDDDGLDESEMVPLFGTRLDDALGDVHTAMPDLPIVFLEFGYAADTSAADTVDDCLFEDRTDDGDQHQADLVSAFMSARADGRYALVEGIFPWENWFVTDANWSVYRRAYEQSGLRTFTDEGGSSHALGSDAIEAGFADWLPE